MVFNLFFLIGLLFFIIGLIHLINQIIFVRSSTIIEGRVIEIVENRDSEGVSYYPLVEYRNEKGEIKTYQTRSWSIWNRRYEEGDLIKLRYLRHKEKDKVYLNSFSDLCSSSIIFFVWGFILVLIRFDGQ